MEEPWITKPSPEVWIVQRAPFHTEVMTGMAHALLTACPGVRITACVPQHREDCWPLFQEQFEGRVTLQRKVPHALPAADLVVITTSRERFDTSRAKRVLRVAHTREEARIQGEVMGLSPIVQPERHLLLTVPWRLAERPLSGRPTVVVVGMSRGYSAKARDADDLSRLVADGRVDVALITRDPPKAMLGMEGLEVHSSLGTKDMVHLLQTRRTFLWAACKPGSWYHRDRVTGIIPLAMSCGVPLVLDERSAELHGGLPCITYRESVLEAVDRLEDAPLPQPSVDRVRSVLRIRG